MRYFLILGNTPQLSLWEIKAVFGSCLVHSPQVVEVESELTAQEIIARVGGVVKVLAAIETIESNDEIVIKRAVQSYFIARQLKKFNLVNLVAGLEIDNAQFKKELGIAGLRYVEGGAWGLSAAVLLHQTHIEELFLIEVEGKVEMAVTRGVQDIDDWTKKDRQKPYADRKKGMLPPKVARMMINIAQAGLENNPKDKNQSSTFKLYDPFCGTGTILMEAKLMGLSVVGSDLDKQAVAGAAENLRWLAANYQLSADFHVFAADVASKQVVSEIGQKQVDLIVTEPFLGKQTPNEEQLAGIFKGLSRLYLGAFKNWRSILKHGGRVMIVLPMVKGQRHKFELNDLIDKLVDLGYTTSSEPVVYARAKATVQRQIYLFEYQQ